MKNLSKFDLAMIIAFVVVAVLGGGAWWYLSGQLQSVKDDVSSAAGDFDKYTKQEIYLPTDKNLKILQANIDALNAQLDPLVKKTLQSPKSSLAGIQQLDSVDWKHNLDEEVTQLTTAAKTHGVSVPDGFYYGFARYLNTNPAAETTANLERQQLAIGTISTILINAPVKRISSVKRTYDEDAGTTSAGSGGAADNANMLPGHAIESAGGVYTAYPLEFEFDTDTEGLRDIVNNLMRSDYVFVIRSMLVQNTKLTSPRTDELDGMAGISSATSQPSIVTSSPGATAVAAAQPSTVGVQYLFGDETLHVRMRVDLIDWHGLADLSNAGSAGRNGSAAGNVRLPRPHTPAKPPAPTNNASGN